MLRFTVSCCIMGTFSKVPHPQMSGGSCNKYSVLLFLYGRVTLLKAHIAQCESFVLNISQAKSLTQTMFSLSSEYEFRFVACAGKLSGFACVSLFLLK